MGQHYPIAERIRELREGRGLSQMDLSKRLGISQTRLSRIERGAGTLAAEELLDLLAIFNVGVDAFRPPQPVEASLQNALVRFGASHLRENTGAGVREEHASALKVVKAVLLRPTSARFVTALAPVLVQSADTLPFPSLRESVAVGGGLARYGWLIDNTLTAIDGVQEEAVGAKERRRLARASLVLRRYSIRREEAEQLRLLDDDGWDPFDKNIRTPRTQTAVRSDASEISSRWRIETRIQPQDFAGALRSALARAVQ